MANVTLALPAGSTVPTQVVMRDGTTATPNASGQITVSTVYLADLLAAGWQIQGSWTGQGHVP